MTNFYEKSMRDCAESMNESSMSKHKQRAQGVQPPPKAVGRMALAAGWPIYEVLLSHGWEFEPHSTLSL
jgi:hypothetical protein